jgi:hypothetical protein
LQINIEKKHLGYFCLFLVLVGGLVVFADGLNNNPGHPWQSINELMDPTTICTAENGLCGSGGGDSYWSQDGSDIYYDSGEVKVIDGNGFEIISPNPNLALTFSNPSTGKRWQWSYRGGDDTFGAYYHNSYNWGVRPHIELTAHAIELVKPVTGTAIFQDGVQFDIGEEYTASNDVVPEMYYAGDCESQYHRGRIQVMQRTNDPNEMDSLCFCSGNDNGDYRWYCLEP